MWKPAIHFHGPFARFQGWLKCLHLKVHPLEDVIFHPKPDQPARKYCPTKLIICSIDRQIAELQHTYQSCGDIWITREIYTNIPTNITNSWRFVTAKEYRNTSWVYLGCKYTLQRIRTNKKNEKHKRITWKNTGMHTWPCLKRRTCNIFVSKSLLKNPTKWMSSTYQVGKNRQPL